MRSLPGGPAQPKKTNYGQHNAAVGAIVDSLGQLADEPIRLSKPTTNLFRARPAAGTGLNTAGLTGVISIDTEARTADVQGMCTYATLVATTLPYGLVPRVVPQLRTITLGGAVAGLGIESTSFRNGLPHESVLDMDVLTPDGQVVAASPDGPHADLFHAFPNSYASLGYALRLTIELEPVSSFVTLQNLRFRAAEDAVGALAQVLSTGQWAGEVVDYCDAVMFGPQEFYVMIGRKAGVADARAWARSAGLSGPSDYHHGERIYYQSIPRRATDVLRIHDYLWRWDTDWFWCSRAFGVQNPLVRSLWPPRLRHSEIYRSLVAFDERHRVMDHLDLWRGQPIKERVIQDVEVPLERAAEFLAWFAGNVPMSPVWLCPLQLSSAQGWPLYPLRPGHGYVNAGFWGRVASQGPDDAAQGVVNRRIEAKVAELGGHKSLYSDVYYTREEFDRNYGGEHYRVVKKKYDPNGRAQDMYQKVTGGK